MLRSNQDLLPRLQIWGVWIGVAFVLGSGVDGLADDHSFDPQPVSNVQVIPMQNQPSAIRTVDDLARLSGVQLEALYRQGTPGAVPGGKVRGVVLYPDSRFQVARSKAARAVWQGKVFDPQSGTATNRFFGVRVVKGAVYSGESWLDGGAALILDYQNTSKVYGNYRDEIRQVAPGVYLGLMYDRTINPPAFKMYFAFSDL